MKQRILSRDNSITEEDLEARLKTAITEREMSKMCDYRIDATMTEEEVLNAALKIILK
jgi:dephospho-CoA kinase